MTDLLARIRSRPRALNPELAKAIRVSADVTQSDVANELGVHRVTVARWELGLRRPRGELLDQYLELLHRLQEAAG
jgi:transcriptional regulator with XRE-family HTH domain